jgi:hypothetical protein
LQRFPKATANPIDPGAPLDAKNHAVRITESADEGISSVEVSTEGSMFEFLTKVNNVFTLTFPVQDGNVAISGSGEVTSSDTITLKNNAITGFFSDSGTEVNESTSAETGETGTARDDMTPTHVVNYIINSPAEVPEPSSLTLLGFGLAAFATLCACRNRRRYVLR